MIRRTRRNRIGGAAVLLAASLALAACGSDDSASTTSNASSGTANSGGGDIHVGGVIPVTGPNSASGQPQINGANAYFAMVNAAGGINGHKLVLDVADDQLNPALSPGAIRTLVEGKKVVMSGFSSSASTAAMVPYAMSKSIVIVPGSGSGDLIKDPKSTVRLAFASYAAEAAAVTDYAVKTLGKKKVAVAYTPDAIGQPTLEGVKSALSAMGMKPVAEVEFSATAKSGAPQAAKLKASGADFVVVNHVAAIATTIIKANEQIGYKPFYGSTQALSNPALVKIVGKGVLDDRIIFSTIFNDPESPDTADYREWVGKEKGSDYKDPNTMNAWVDAAAIVELLKKAVNDNGGNVPTPEQVLKSAAGLKIDNTYNKGIDWTETKWTGATQGRIIGLKGDEYPEIQGFAPLPAGL